MTVGGSLVGKLIGGIRWQEDELNIGQVENRRMRWEVVKKNFFQTSARNFGLPYRSIPRISDCPSRIFLCLVRTGYALYIFSLFHSMHLSQLPLNENKVP